MIKRGKYLGQVIDDIGIQKLKTYLSKFKVELQIGKGNGIFEIDGFFYNSGNPVTLKPNEAAMFITDGLKMKLVIRENATLYEVFHELMHFRDCQKIGMKAFLKKTLVDKEKFVYDKMVEYAKYLNKNELKHAEWYINDNFEKIGKTDNLGNPIVEIIPFDLNKIPNKRQEINIDKILKLK